MRTVLILAATIAVLVIGAAASSSNKSMRIQTTGGIVEGATEASGIHVFRGIPYAAPPVGDLRWKPPQPVDAWDGARPAVRFGDQCLQHRVFDDMQFRNSGKSEDCLYLNVWTPDASSDALRPVLVYFYGGGFIAGDGSEPRYDGESMAKEGIVVVTMSYRLGVFGFFAHPELTAESPHDASGNYALLDQSAAMHWVRDNIAAFGGDPDRVTIAGESAGSFAVSAQMASLLSRDLIAGAIGESGSLLGSRAPASLDEMEANGSAFAERIGAGSLQELRAKSGLELLNASSRPGMPRFSTTVDGYFFPKTPAAMYVAGEQSRVPLLVGWNTEEMNFRAVLAREEPTPENFAAAVRTRYGDDADAILEHYRASTTDEVVQAATDLAGDQFIGYSTWKWSELHRKTGDAPVYRYLYAHPRPAMLHEFGGPSPDDPPTLPLGAAHSAEIEYALGNLDANPIYAWGPEDYAVSEIMKGYFANFIKSGDPNGAGLPEWPRAGREGSAVVMRIDVDPQAAPEANRDRYLLLDRLVLD